MAATNKAGLLVKKKIWMPVVAPKEFGEQPIGETFVTEGADATGRTLTVSMASLSGDPQRQSISVFFKVTGSENGRAVTQITGIGWLPAAVRRIVRRGREKMDESFEVVTGDARRVRVKMLMVGKSKTTSGVTAQLRKLCRAAVQRSAIHRTWVDFIAGIMQHNLQKEVQDALKKTYPLSVCEVRQAHAGGTAPAELVEKLRVDFPLPKEPAKVEPEKAQADEIIDQVAEEAAAQEAKNAAAALAEQESTSADAAGETKEPADVTQ